MRAMLCACVTATTLALAAAPFATGGTPARPPGELWSQFPLEPTTTSPAPAIPVAPGPQRHPAPELPRSVLLQAQPQETEQFDSALVLVALTLAIALLALASGSPTVMPRSRLTAVVADRRLEIALAGATVLLAVTIVYVLAII